jgi:hypothetical protein
MERGEKDLYEIFEENERNAYLPAQINPEDNPTVALRNLGYSRFDEIFSLPE